MEEEEEEKKRKKKNEEQEENKKKPVRPNRDKLQAGICFFSSRSMACVVC